MNVFNKHSGPTALMKVREDGFGGTLLQPEANEPPGLTRSN